MEIMENTVEILVADDEPSVALALKAALKFCGYSAHSVSDGQAALEQIRAEPGRFAALVTDHTMPRLGGLALVRALRDAAFTGRVVLVSAFLTQEIEEQYRLLGVDQILSKPFNIERLRGAMDRALHPNGASRKTVRPSTRGEGTPLRIHALPRHNPEAD